MVRCYSGETYSNGGRRNRITRKIHPLDSVRLTLNCDAGTLCLDVNGVDQGVVFSNVPPDVHPAVCFYGVAKSVRLVELKRIYGDSDSDSSDSEDESDGESMAEQSQGADEAKPPPVENEYLRGKDLSESSEMDTSAGSNRASSARRGVGIDADKVSQESPDESSKRRARRREDETIASTIRAVAAAAPSSGLLAGLANFAQWYVPRDRGDQHGATDQRSGLGEVDGKRATQMPNSASLEAMDGGLRPLFPGVYIRSMTNVRLSLLSVFSHMLASRVVSRITQICRNLFLINFFPPQ